MKSRLAQEFTSATSHLQVGTSIAAIKLVLCALIALIPLQMLGQATPFLNQSLSPTTAAPGGNAFTLTVTGSGFASDAVVNWNGSPRVTTFVSNEKLTAAILKTDIAKVGTATITVNNPGGSTSNRVFFPIGRPSPAVSMGRVDTTTSPSAAAIAVADFRGKGILDLAVANSGGNSVSIYLGNGNGTFQNPVNYPTVVGYPDAILVADFNNDGKMDLAVLLQRSSKVSILLGNGDGTFGAPQAFSTGQNPVGFAVGDLNQDGKLDLAVANYTDSTVSILFGNGDGTFQTHQDYSTAVNPEDVAIGDFNNDGSPDLAVASNFVFTNTNKSHNTYSTVSILLNSGSGTFPTHNDLTTAAAGTSVVAADLNNDGNLDLAVVTASYSVSILLGNGDGTFQTHKEYGIGANAQAIAVGDLNNDGRLDLATANFSDNTVSVLGGNGDGTFKLQQVYPTNAGPVGMALGDFTGAGKLGMTTVDSNASKLSVLTTSQLSVTPTFVAFGSQEAGIASNPQTITLKNSSAAAIGLSSFTFGGTNPGDFSQTNNCNGSIAAGASCTISLTITAAAAGFRSGQLVIGESNGSSTGLGMTGTGLITITLGPTRYYTFPGTQLLNTKSAPKVFTFTNQSGVNVTISSIVVNAMQNAGDFPQTNNCPGTLAPAESCTINQIYDPTVVGQEQAFLTVFGNFTAGNGQQAVQLTGNSTAVSVTPTSLTFPAQTVGTTSSPQTITFFNAGSSSMPVTFVRQGANPKDFAQTNNCNGSVPANSSCTINVTFTPGATGARSAQLSIGDSDPTGPQIVTLSGTGQ